MQTNVLGMSLFADGGVLAWKPYAASGNYINKMSDCCRGCRFDRTVRSGENACPFNFFYWDFLARHRDKLQSIGRLSFIDRQSRQNGAVRIGNHPPKSCRLARCEGGSATVHAIGI